MLRELQRAKVFSFAEKKTHAKGALVRIEISDRTVNKSESEAISVGIKNLDVRIEKNLSEEVQNPSENGNRIVLCLLHRYLFWNSNTSYTQLHISVGCCSFLQPAK